jgi:hypothetical protein
VASADAGHWVTINGAHILIKGDARGGVKHDRTPSNVVRVPNHRDGGVTNAPRGGADLQIWQRKQWGDYNDSMSGGRP